jgi:hypothetical protein
MYIIAAPKEKKKEKNMTDKIARGHEDGGWPKLSPRDQRQRHAPLIGTPK